MESFKDRISASLLRIGIINPFFATLSMYAEFIESDKYNTAATDGKRIFCNPEFIKNLDNSQFDGLILHEVLHAALLHPIRCQKRLSRIWNWAADIVVNGMILDQGYFSLPDNGVINNSLKDFSVEEVYDQLIKQNRKAPDEMNIDLLDERNGEDESELSHNPFKNENYKELKRYWDKARRQAEMIAKQKSSGSIPKGWQREVDELKPAKINWKHYLWRFLVKTPFDYQGFDRRFIHRGLYLEELDGETLKVYVAIDTSGSISKSEITEFMSELRGIVSIYQQIECELYFTDSSIYGPYQISMNSELPVPEGCGGTSFHPFFYKIKERALFDANSIAVYLTDGFAEYPKENLIFPC